MAQRNFRKDLIRAVTFLAGIYFFLEFILPQAVLDAVGVTPYHTNITRGFITVGVMAIGLGIINLFMVHGTKVLFVRKDWSFSFVLLLGLVVMMSMTTADWLTGRQITVKGQRLTVLRDFVEAIKKDAETPPKIKVPEKSERIRALTEATPRELQAAQVEILDIAEKLPKQLNEGDAAALAASVTEFEELSGQINGFALEELQGDDQRLTEYGKLVGDAGLVYQKVLRAQYEASQLKKAWTFLHDGLFVALGSAMFSLLGVYLAAAAYRAFRVKTVESILMMSAALVVMLGQIPFYEYISYSLPEYRQWLLEIPNSAAFRAIKIGAAVAGLVMAFRMWLSIESESFSPRGARK